MQKIFSLKQVCSTLSLYVMCSIIFSLNSSAQNMADIKEHGLIVKPNNYIPLLQDASSRSGKVVFQQNNCMTCHSISGQGGCLAPPLDGIGAYRSKEFILSRITRGPAAEAEFAKLYGKPELMPHLRIAPNEAKLITQYLLTLPIPTNGFLVGTHKTNINVGKSTEKQETIEASDPTIIKEGRQLVYQYGCIACHSIHGIGGHFAPTFDDLNKRRTENHVREHITNVEFFTQNGDDEYGGRGTVMPPSGLSKAEIDKICKFLMSCN